MNKLVSLYRDAVRSDWDNQTDATLANMQEAEQNILSHLAAGEAAVKKVAELEQEISKVVFYACYKREMEAAMVKIAELEKEVERLKEEIEVEIMRLVGCGVAANQNTETTIKDRITLDSPYFSASYASVCNAVDREIALRQDKRELVEELERCLYRTDAVYLPPTYNSLKALIAKHKEAL